VERISEGRETRTGWGIEPVPGEQRVLSALDLAVLWGDLGIGILVLVTGALLVPGLGFPAAMVAILTGSTIGAALLALAGAAGAGHGIPTMVLFRPVLGIRGSWLPSILNVVQLIGWTAVELWAMSYVADLVARQIFGFSARGLWLAIAAFLCTALALWGPVGVTKVWMKRFGAWMITGICIALTILLLTSGGIGDVVTRAGSGGWPSFGAALDLVIAMPISWLPLVADYNRFSRRPRAAFIGTFGGYLVANIWLYSLGALLVLQAGATQDPAGIAAGILAIAGGSVAGVLFLVGLLVGETDEAFADIYSGALSVQNIWPRLPQSAGTIGIAAASTGLAAWLTMQRYESFLFLIGSVFIPLFGILIADHFVNRRGRVQMTALYDEGGRYWYRSGVRFGSLVPWIAGFAVYHWIVPTGPSWWLEAAESVLGSPLIEAFPWLPASLPSFAVAFLLALKPPLRGLRLSSEAPSRRGEDEDRSQVQHV
jgi:nucleobase:cation symporter-1, NCS1 family